MTTGEITGLVVFAVIGIIAIVCALMDSGNEENNTTKALSPAMQRIESHRATDSDSVKSRKRSLRDKKDSTTTHVIKSRTCPRLIERLDRVITLTDDGFNKS